MSGTAILYGFHLVSHCLCYYRNRKRRNDKLLPNDKQIDGDIRCVQTFKTATDEIQLKHCYVTLTTETNSPKHFFRNAQNPSRLLSA